MFVVFVRLVEPYLLSQNRSGDVKLISPYRAHRDWPHLFWIGDDVGSSWMIACARTVGALVLVVVVALSVTD